MRRSTPRQRMAKVLRSPAHERLLAFLRTARREAGLTQTELAALIGKPQSFVAKVEGGERRLDVVEYVALCRAIGADPTEGLQIIESSQKAKS